jgi:hypothetical protein
MVHHQAASLDLGMCAINGPSHGQEMKPLVLVLLVSWTPYALPLHGCWVSCTSSP